MNCKPFRRLAATGGWSLDIGFCDLGAAASAGVAIFGEQNWNAGDRDAICG